MKYGPEMTHEIVTYLQNGNGRVDTCHLVGISYETFTQWMKLPEFSESIKKAESTCKARNIAIVQKAAITSWQAAAWWLERKYPQEFALKARVDENEKEEVSGRMAERAAELLKKLEGGKTADVSRNGNGVHA